MPTGRRTFLKTVAAASAAQIAEAAPQAGQPAPSAYPRRFAGRQLSMIAFPLGGVGAGAIALGGRGQLRDWEIYNKSERGRAPQYCFPAIWVQTGNSKPVARVLESRILPPYEGRDGLGVQNAPGLTRLDDCIFTGEYPLA